MKAPASPWLLAIVPLLFAAIGLPLALELVGPNPFYGVRIEATQVSESEWYRINRAAGVAGVAAGLAGFLASVLIVRSGMASQRKRLACLAVVIGAAAVIVATSLAAA